MGFCYVNLAKCPGLCPSAHRGSAEKTSDRNVFKSQWKGQTLHGCIHVDDVLFAGGAEIRAEFMRRVRAKNDVTGGDEPVTKFCGYGFCLTGRARVTWRQAAGGGVYPRHYRRRPVVPRVGHGPQPGLRAPPPADGVVGQRFLSQGCASGLGEYRYHEWRCNFSCRAALDDGEQPVHGGRGKGGGADSGGASGRGAAVV